MKIPRHALIFFLLLIVFVMARSKRTGPKNRDYSDMRVSEIRMNGTLAISESTPMEFLTVLEMIPPTGNFSILAEKERPLADDWFWENIDQFLKICVIEIAIFLVALWLSSKLVLFLVRSYRSRIIRRQAASRASMHFASRSDSVRRFYARSDIVEKWALADMEEGSINPSS